MESKDFFFIILVSFFVYQAVDSCSCSLRHPQEYACSSDYVIVANVTERQAEHSEQAHFSPRSFDINIIKILKLRNSAAKALGTRRIYTSSNGGLCGINLQPNINYLITGQVYDDKAHVSLCNFVKPWQQLSFRQRKGFRLLYYQGCNCRINSCYKEGMCPSDPDTCQWDQGGWYNLNDCHSKSSVCIRHQSGNCKWIHDKYYKSCVIRQQEP